MQKFEKEDLKTEMLEEMEHRSWDMETDINSSYEEVKEDYDEMVKEFDAAVESMYPNKRDTDAENFDD